MEFKDVMQILQDDMKIAVYATVDADGKPHARHAHVGVANEKGIFFMTSRKTNFYQQLQVNDNIAVTGISEEGYLIQVIRVEGKVREIGKAGLEEMLAGNPYVQHVYPSEEDQANVQVFHIYEGEGFYQSLTQGHKYLFKFGESHGDVIPLT